MMRKFDETAYVRDQSRTARGPDTLLR